MLTGAFSVRADDAVTTSTVFWFHDPSHTLGTLVPGAFSTLEREHDGVSMTLHTRELDPGAVYTVWWVIFNQPQNCSAPGCGGKDLGNPAVGPSVQFAAGTFAGPWGVADFAAELDSGDTSGCQVVPPLPCGSGLTNPQGAEIHFVVRNHGQPIEGLVDQQLSSFAGGCQSGNLCIDAQASRQQP